ncbi:hypothetical protein [Halanaerobium salsuginis]|jgi:peroxiredoxin (alkyl hydroperoxide reductase subunit C)|uniref:Uncharacterized protein n=1 Tax=Halanaerobium salsuginis TaxID=29563 RepID=A0A1I4I8Q5_9FIRM|nr:hypothetical protein [Halanaerobium salsuginis]SFL50769.1 hypothetical protein SAMN02983006_01353 [Halanaerobium salsuginis]
MSENKLANMTDKFDWSGREIFNYELLKHPEKNKTYLEKRKIKLAKGEIECDEWWLCKKQH